MKQTEYLNKKQQEFLSAIYTNDQDKMLNIMKDENLDITFDNQQALYTCLIDNKQTLLLYLLVDKRFNISLNDYEFILSVIGSFQGFSEKSQNRFLKSIFNVPQVFNKLTVYFLKELIIHLKDSGYSQELVDTTNSFLKKKIQQKMYNF